MNQKLAPILIVTVLLAEAGCGTSMSPASRQPVAAVEAPAPVPVLSPEQERDRDEARQAYVGCLAQAIRYVSEKAAGSADEAALIAPMCYAQFLRFEHASTVAFSDRDRRAFDRKGDKRQLEFAGDAIRQSRGLAALSTNP